MVQGKCCRSGQAGHNGKAPPAIRKSLCKAFDAKCQKCRQAGHYSKFCKKPPEKIPKEASVKSNTVSVMHSTVGTTSSNLCQYRVSAKEIGYKQAIQKRLSTRTNVMLQNEEHDKLSNKFVQMKPAPPAKIKVRIKLDIPA